MSSMVEVAGLILLVTTYGTAVLHLWHRSGGHRIVGPWRATSFLMGMALIALATVGPGDDMADRGTAAHMAQHVVLMLIAAPLLAVGRPLEVFHDAAPHRNRSSLRPVTRLLVHGSSGPGWAVSATAAVVLHSAVMVGWHIPLLYDLAVRNAWVHGVEHATLVAAAFGLWWVALGGMRKGPAPAAILVLFAANVPMTVLGFAMVFASTPWYAAYPTGLADQQAAGAVLWGVGGAIVVTEAVAAFGLWLAGPDHELTPHGRSGSSSVDGVPAGMRPR